MGQNEIFDSFLSVVRKDDTSAEDTLSPELMYRIGTELHKTNPDKYKEKLRELQLDILNQAKLLKLAENKDYFAGLLIFFSERLLHLNRDQLPHLSKEEIAEMMKDLYNKTDRLARVQQALKFAAVFTPIVIFLSVLILHSFLAGIICNFILHNM